MKTIFDKAVDKARFSMSNLYRTVFEQEIGPSGGGYREEFEFIADALGKRNAKKTFQALLRFAFFIEPVKQPKIDSTKYAVRWGPELSTTDPRHCPYELCLEIFESLLQDLIQVCQEQEKRELLDQFLQNQQIAYEIPLDYIKRKIDEPIHRPENIAFFWEDLSKKVIRLRAYLLDSTKYAHSDFFKAAYGKIIVKTYLTDRVLTGVHKTNREKRWEVHPASVHFALRRDSLAIEAALINQLCYFAGFPQNLQQELENEGLISFRELQDPVLAKTDTQISRCPITLEPLSFEEFKQEVLSPQHGKASYQVGHLHPLKATSDNVYRGHTANNISWISSQGNRIQGEYSVEETRELMMRIIKNYKSVGLVE